MAYKWLKWLLLEIKSELSLLYVIIDVLFLLLDSLPTIAKLWLIYYLYYKYMGRLINYVCIFKDDWHYTSTQLITTIVKGAYLYSGVAPSPLYFWSSWHLEFTESDVSGWVKFMYWWALLLIITSYIFFVVWIYIESGNKTLLNFFKYKWPGKLLIIITLGIIIQNIKTIPL